MTRVSNDIATQTATYCSIVKGAASRSVFK